MPDKTVQELCLLYVGPSAFGSTGRGEWHHPGASCTMKIWFDTLIHPVIILIQQSLDRARSNRAPMECKKCVCCVQVLQRLAAQGGENGTVRVPAATMKGWFDALIDLAIARIQYSLGRARSNGSQVECMLVVGGLASSAYFTARLREAFSHEVKDISYPSVLYQTVLTGEGSRSVMQMRCPVDWTSSSSPVYDISDDISFPSVLYQTILTGAWVPDLSCR